ncbi:hypothetical protein ACLOJK_034254 [Asimina triloba]
MDGAGGGDRVCRSAGRKGEWRWVFGRWNGVVTVRRWRDGVWLPCVVEHGRKMGVGWTDLAICEGGIMGVGHHGGCGLWMVSRPWMLLARRIERKGQICRRLLWRMWTLIAGRGE